jgi:hypothetical protein
MVLCGDGGFFPLFHSTNCVLLNHSPITEEEEKRLRLRTQAVSANKLNLFRPKTRPKTMIISVVNFRRSRQFVYAFCALLLCGLSGTQANAQSSTSVTSATVRNEAFGLGEELSYNVGYKGIVAGTGTFKIAPKAVERSGASCFDINFEAQSLKSLEWIYKLRNTYRTLLDVQTLLPRYFEQHNREGGYKRDAWAEFDHRSFKARTSEGDVAIEAATHDVVSAFFYIRALNLRDKKRGDLIMLKQFSDRRVFDLAVRVLGRQTISVEAGTFNCLVIEPLLVEGGLFKNDGRVLIWLSDDDRKIPVKVSSKILIGSVDVALTSYKGLRGALTARVADAEKK